MNVTVANTLSFAKDSLNLAKETAVNYGGRAINQLKHLPVTMHEDFRVACGVTATVTAVALIVGECFGEYVWKKVDGNDRKPASEVVKRLVFTATLASAYAGLSYATGFPQSKTVSALIVISFTAIRCLVSALDWQKTSIGYLEGQDTLREEKNTLQTQNNHLTSSHNKDSDSTITSNQNRQDLENFAKTSSRKILEFNKNLKLFAYDTPTLFDQIYKDIKNISIKSEAILIPIELHERIDMEFIKNLLELVSKNNTKPIIIIAENNINNNNNNLEQTDLVEKITNLNQKAIVIFGGFNPVIDSTGMGKITFFEWENVNDFVTNIKNCLNSL